MFWSWSSVVKKDSQLLDIEKDLKIIHILLKLTKQSKKQNQYYLMLENVKNLRHDKGKTAKVIVNSLKVPTTKFFGIYSIHQFTLTFL